MSKVIHGDLHAETVLAGHYPAVPGERRRIEVTEVRFDLTHHFRAHLVADAATPLHVIDILGLVLKIGTLQRERAFGRNIQQRIPVIGWVVLRGSRGAGRNDGGEGNGVAGRRFDRLGVHQAVASDPDLVGGLRQLRQQVAAGVVGDDDLAELRGQIGGFRDHPHAGFRALRIGDHAADVVGVDRHAARRSLRSRAALRRGSFQPDHCGKEQQAERKQSDRFKNPKRCTVFCHHDYLSHPERIDPADSGFASKLPQACANF